MAQCTAPRNGHRTASGRANCPACGGSSRSYGYGYSSTPSYPSTPSYSSSASNRGGTSSGGTSRSRVKAGWSGPTSLVLYTPTQVQELTPTREKVEELAEQRPDLRDVFLCHAWNDRKEAAKQLHDLLEARGVKVWFSEKDAGLGLPLMRTIDKGLANSRVGIVLVTPALLKGLPNEGIADKELSVLLRGQRLIPVLHDTTFEALNDVSPMLASRTGLNTKEETMEEVAAQIADLVTVC